MTRDQTSLSRLEPATQAAAPYDPYYARMPGYPKQSDEDDTIDLRRLWGIVRRNAWLLAGVLALSLVVGFWLTRRAVPIYEATASLRITNDEGGIPGLEVLRQMGGAGNEVNTELEVLRSRSLAAVVVDSLQLRARIISPRKLLRSEVFSRLEVADQTVSGEWRVLPDGTGFRLEGPAGGSDTGLGAAPRSAEGVSLAIRGESGQQSPITVEIMPREQAISDLIESLRISRPSRDANILVVRYRGPDPVLVQQVPNALVHAYVARRVGTRKTGARSTVEFLRGQLDTLERELRIAEDSLRQFREAEQVVSIDVQAAASVDKLAELQADRNLAASELAAIEATLREAQGRNASPDGSAYRKLLAFPTLLRNPVISTLLQNITTLENERATLLVRRTERDPDVISLTGQVQALEDQIAGVVTTYTEGLRQQVTAYDRTLASSGDALARIPAKEVRLAQLARDTKVLTELFTLMQTRLKEAEVAQAVEDPSAQVVDFAALPTLPVSPRMALNLVLAALIGLLLGGTIAAGRELLDNKVHTREELQQVTFGLPVLGVIPRFEAETIRQVKSGSALRHRNEKSTALVARETPESTVLEAYRALRTSLAYSGVGGGPPKVILLTSATPDDGKSTTTANLAASLAQQKQRVLVIDADLRRGSLHRTLGGTRTPGLTEVLTGRAEMADVIQPQSFEGVGRIDLISTGTVPPNPAELLGSTRMPDLLEWMESRYDTILIDTPPVNAVADVLVLAKHVDGVLLVARGGKTERGALKFALDQLATVRAPVLGTLLNDYDHKRAAAYGGEYYRYHYGAA